MDSKTKIQVIISLTLVFLIGLLTYWIQLPADDLKAQVLQESPTILVRIQDFAFISDVVRIDKGTVVSWLNDETDANAGVQHTVISYDPDDSTKGGDLFQSGLLSQGDTFTQSFTEDGVYYYNCSLHPFMTGKVCVGASSELDDPDCAIENTEANTTLGDETTGDETTPADEEVSPPALTLPPAETVEEENAAENNLNEETATVTGAGNEVLEEGLPETEESGVLLINLQEAADEDYKPYASGTNTPTYNSTSYPKTANSGPEDLIYLLPALVSLYVAKKWVSYTA